MAIHWFILIVLLVIIVQGQIYQRWGQKKLSYTRSFNVKRCSQDDEIEMVEEISNKKLLPLPWLRVESLLHAGMQFQAQHNLDISNGEFVQNHKSFFSLLPFTKITRRHRVTCIKRGIYRINSVSLTCGDAFGLIRNSKRLELDAELIVYPKLMSLEELQLPSQSWQGDITVKRWIVEDPFMVAGVREYRYGDSLKSVNWKATARTGELQVNQRDFTADRRLMILLNIEDHEGMWNTVNEVERAEKGIAYAAALSQAAISQGMEAGFATNACMLDKAKAKVRIEPRSGEDHQAYVLETMARLLIEPSVAFHELLEEEAMEYGRRFDYCIITAFVSEKMQFQLDLLAQNGHNVDVIYLHHDQTVADKAKRSRKGEYST
ncbi:DUF58 domain-containing protein [Paenibacillus abyssi]|uniref:DUF58 domain-containing protein n=1 Tax=Paenibacillus abyssi TaxID=1340531 RepID=A0A917CJ49_9BACL|nr:DUF58 domain-containing protein [Paenibacillus abyssi]GGF90280.1 hypothetical protein GCM10010916_04580 [Paenibacillus abyssi]